MGLAHGGRLNRAAAAYGIAVDQWLDLSTGINPRSWPVPGIPEAVWQRLPEADDGLDAIAREWAGAPAAAGCVALPGSQAAIQLLPRLRAPGRVGVPAPGYAEHAHWWRAAGHEVVALAHDAAEDALDELDALVWIHPNNPTGLCLSRQTLCEWHRRLARRGGWLVLDEAFVDPTPEASLVVDTGPDGLIVLRSTGKFFGLAGLRGGFCFGPPALCDELEAQLGPWAVSHPARWVLARALADRDWQHATREALAAQAAALDAVLQRHGLIVAGGTALFRYCPHPQAAAIQDRLARQGILSRTFEEPPALRFGLPPDAAGLQRLDAALDRLKAHQPQITQMHADS
jgi:cobalamin biosynthetic protein CobC